MTDLPATPCPLCGCPGAGMLLQLPRCLSLACEGFCPQERGAYEVKRLREQRRRDVHGMPLARFWRWNGAFNDVIEAGLEARDGKRT